MLLQSTKAHGGLSLVTNPYAFFLMHGAPKLRKLYAENNAAPKDDAVVLDILPDSSRTPFGESALWLIRSVQASSDATSSAHTEESGDETSSMDATTASPFLKAMSHDEFRTERHRFHVSGKVSAGAVPVVPCVFSLPYDRTLPISDVRLPCMQSADCMYTCDECPRNGSSSQHD